MFCTICGTKIQVFCTSCNSKKDPNRGWNKGGFWLWKVIPEGERIPDDATHGWWKDNYSGEEIANKENAPWPFSTYPHNVARNKGDPGFQDTIYVFKANIDR